MSDDCYVSAAPIDVSCLLVTALWAQIRSKDPRTKVGAGVYDPVSGAIYLGYNGLPPGVPDLKSIWDNRDAYSPGNKYQYAIHAEANAIRKAALALGDLSNCILYVTHYPCHSCMKDFIIPFGIKHVVYMQSREDKASEELASASDIEVVRSMLDVDVINGTTKDWAGWPKTITITERKSQFT